MADKSFAAALNEQIANEFGASQQYVGAAVYYDAETLPRLAAFFYRQALEEREHAMIMIRYLLDTDEEVHIPDIKSQETSYSDGVAPVKMALEQEKRVSDEIFSLFELARDAKDYRAEQFLTWFVKEQVEEVALMNDLLNVVERSKDNLLLAEEYIARESLGEESADPTAPPAAGALAHAGDAAELGDVLAQGRGSRRGQEAGGDRLLGDAFLARGDPVGAGATAGGERRGPAVALPEQAGVVVEPVATRHAVADRLQVGGAALGLVVVVDAEAAAEQAEAGRGGGPTGGLGDPGLEPAHRAGALPGEDGSLPPGEAEQGAEVVRLPDRDQIDEAAAADVDQILFEQVVAQRHRPAPEPEEREVGGVAGALAEDRVEAADLIRGVAACGWQDADLRPPSGAFGGEPQHQLADGAIRRSRGELVPTEGEDSRDHYAAAAVDIASGRGTSGAMPGPSPRKVVAIRISTTRSPSASSR